MAHDDGQRGNAFSPYETPLFDHVQAGPSVTTIPPRLAIVKLLQLCDQLEYATKITTNALDPASPLQQTLREYFDPQMLMCVTLQNQKTKELKTIEYPLAMAHLLWLSPESQTSGFRVRNGGLREMPLSDGSMLVESSRTHLTTEWAGGIMFEGRGSLEVHMKEDLTFCYWHLTLLDMRITFDATAVSTLLDHHRKSSDSAPADAIDVADAFMKTIDTACDYMSSDWGITVHNLRLMEIGEVSSRLKEIMTVTQTEGKGPLEALKWLAESIKAQKHD